ncbi:MAG: phosphomethylpyrimidine synthase ThiC, partial [Crocinitomicaceae bacterium]|nr:phosphomethylpyrimidine synthase ThiC [Crocinitomicaceae bacterium]
MSKKESIPSLSSKITRDAFPASKKIYVNGSIHNNIKVAMREISLSDSKPMFSNGEFTKEINHPLPVYDTSGPYTDAEIDLDVKEGVPRIREQWIFDRGDVRRLSDISSDFGKERLLNSDLDHLRFEHIK